jgi:hypothetical protein
MLFIANYRDGRMNMLSMLDQLKRDINRMIISNDYNKEELVKKSQELDKYIVQAMKQCYEDYKNSKSDTL